MHLTVLQDETMVLGGLTYGELAERALAVGRGLIKRDIVPGDRVA
jgi:acyl-CoA synthetase (AMP-forming)/AMP-acid ligase II